MSEPITLTAFANAPDQGRGLARDMRVRWALEEVGERYEERLVPMDGLKQPPHLARQPFGQIPSYEQGGLVLFESGAIVLHIAELHPGTLLPSDAGARARAITWLFAALSTLEPPVIEREAFMLLEKDKPWFAARLPLLDDKVHKRLAALSAQLGEGDWLEDRFTAGDLMMIEVLVRPASRQLLPAYANLEAYVARGEARPAFQRALAAQHEAYEKTKPQTAEQGA